jgi:glycosyltransferase involved in cell wall biosynthesis
MSFEKMEKVANRHALVADLISIIVPVYNAEKFLDRSIKSVLSQSYKNIELILINDGSTDSSERIVNRYALADKRIKVISQKNSGPASARNLGLRHAKGAFAFFLDADDLIDKKTIKLLIAKYNKSQPDLVISNFSKLENNGERIKQSVTFHPDGEPFEDQVKKLSKRDIVDYVRHFLKYPSNHLISYCWARLYKLSIIKENNIFFNEGMRLFEDFVFNLEYLKHTNKIVFVNESLYTYTMHKNHISASMTIMNSDSLLHDIDLFKRKGSEFLQKATVDTLDAIHIKKELGHALIHYVIIFTIRSCRQVTRHNRKKIYNEIDKMVNAPIFRDSLQHYSPSKGNSRILPLLMRLKLVNLIIFVCKYKAYKRYSKPEDD